MGIAVFLAILAYVPTTIIGGILLFNYTRRFKLLSYRWLFGACLTVVISIILLSKHGLDEHHLYGEYSNIAIIWYGLVGWHTLILAAGIFGAIVWRKGQLIVGMSSGCAIAAIWWFIHIFSLTQWK